jgi:hypothetical protein
VKLAIVSIDKNAFLPASYPHGFRGSENLSPAAWMRPDLTEEDRIVLSQPPEVAIFGLPLRRRTASRIGKDIIMSIGNAVQRGSVVYVYDEKGRQIASISAGSGPKDGLTGYTSSTVNVRRGSVIYTYDAHGRQTASTTAR